MLRKKLADATAAEAVIAIGTVLAVFTTLIYVLGGATLALRLWIKRLPAETVLGGLPREFLITVGLGVTYQLLLFLGLMSVTLVPAPSATWKRRLKVLALTGAAVLAWPVFRSFPFYRWGWLLVVLLAALVTAFVLHGVTKRVVANGVGKTWVKLAGSLLLFFLLVFGVWRLALEVRATRVLDAKVCMTDGDDLSGLFIGENDDSIYLGERRGSSGEGGFLAPEKVAPRIAAIPRTSVAVLFIGPHADEAACPPPSDDSPQQ